MPNPLLFKFSALVDAVMAPEKVSTYFKTQPEFFNQIRELYIADLSKYNLNCFTPETVANIGQVDSDQWAPAFRCQLPYGRNTTIYRAGSNNDVFECVNEVLLKFCTPLENNDGFSLAAFIAIPSLIALCCYLGHLYEKCGRKQREDTIEDVENPKQPLNPRGPRPSLYGGVSSERALQEKNRTPDSPDADSSDADDGSEHGFQ